MVVRQFGRLRADLLPAERCTALLLLVHRRLHRQRLQIADAGRAGALRSDDHRLQSRRHVRRRSHPPGAPHLSRRLLGIGEFSIHKEFVSSKVSGETASLTNPALDRVLDFAAEAGLVVILHNDIDMPFGKVGCRAGLPDADEGPAEAAPEGHDHLGPHRPRAGRPSGAGLGGGRRAHADAPRDPRGHARRSGRSVTSPSTSRGTKSRSTRSRHRRQPRG